MSFNIDKITNLPNLTLNDTHSDITALKYYLKRFGYLGNHPTLENKTLDISTQDALSNYQKKMGLNVSGNFDTDTRRIMLLTRCGTPDLLDPLGATAVGPWTRRNLSFAFGTLSTQVSENLVKTAIRNAFSTWSNAGVDLNFVEVRLSENPDIQVEWRPADDSDRNMTGLLVAHADFPPGFSLIVHSLPLPLHFDDEEHQWTVGQAIGQYDIETIALHEIGHCLGLVHSSSIDAVMYATVQPNHLSRFLQLDDLQQLRRLYP